MVPSIARQSVILKCNMQKSVMLGNYEFFYAAGLMRKLYNIEIRTDMEPEQILEAILQMQDNLAPQSEQEKYLIQIIKNYEPQNRVYRYNYFYDNCTTRARDILLDNINGTIRYRTRNKNSESYREMTHAYNEHQRWARFGNDLLLGIKADFPTAHEQQQFLPDNLRKDFDNAVIIDKDGGKRPLVSDSTWVVLPGIQPEWSGFPLSPTSCAISYLVIGVLVETALYR